MVITTRSGKILSGPFVGKNIVDEVVDDEPEEGGPVGAKKLDNPPNALEKEKYKENEVVVTTTQKPSPSFPQRLKKKTDETKFSKFMSMLKQLTMNVPFVEALEKMLGYSKFMKDLLKNKRAVRYELVENLHHCNVVSTRSLVQKKANLGAFTIPCTIGSFYIAKALCDLMASINLMPLVMYGMLGLRDLTPINMRLVMADRSVNWPIGILHDVLVNVADFTLPPDFVVLNCDVDFEVPIILGRPFLATRRVIVDIELNELNCLLNDKEARFAIHSPMT
ncbi:uncharacterized protein LOC124892682 [Capsicum annuum]|uniref:uncharacterized protein LOC124892682 n=1 Tax=Capsicum annuum TaxID=4072 RepID=UPI001FB07090|nr:uncharacterized protein LOC124892682 [Capsicum annuum]